MLLWSLWSLFSAWLVLNVTLTILFNNNIHVLQWIIKSLDASLTEKDVEAMNWFDITWYLCKHFSSFCYYRLGGFMFSMIRGLVSLVFNSNGNDQETVVGRSNHSITGKEKDDTSKTLKYNTPSRGQSGETHGKDASTEVPFSNGSDGSDVSRKDDDTVSSCRYGGLNLSDFETVEDAGTMNTSRYGGFDYNDFLGHDFESKGDDGAFFPDSRYYDDFSADPIGMLESTWNEEKKLEEAQDTATDPLQELRELCEKANRKHRANFETLERSHNDHDHRIKTTMDIIKAEGSGNNAKIKQVEERQRVAKHKREEKIRQIKDLVHENASKNPVEHPLYMNIINDLLDNVKKQQVRVDESIAKKLTDLQQECMDILEELDDMELMKVDILHPEKIDIAEYEEEATTLNQIMVNSTAIRLRVGNHATLKHALRVKKTLNDLWAQEKDRKKASQSILADVSLPEASIPWLGELDKGLREYLDKEEYLEDDNKVNIRKLLTHSIDLFDQFTAIHNLNLNKNQIYLLWSKIFDAFIRAVSKIEKEEHIYYTAYLLYGVFHRIGGTKISYAVLRKLLIENMVKVSPICLPSLSHEEDDNEECSKILNERLNIVRLYGATLSIFSQDRHSSNSTVLKEAWTWWIRTSKILIRASLMLDQKNSGAKKHSEEVLHRRILETCRALRIFLHVCGNTLLEKYRHHILGDNRLLNTMLIPLGTLAGKVYVDSGDKFKDHVKAVTEVKEFIESCLQNHIFRGALFESQRSLYGNLLVVVNESIMKQCITLESSDTYKNEANQRESIPWRLGRVGGLFSKEKCVERIQALILDINKNRKELMKTSFVKIAKLVVKCGCGDGTFDRKKKASPLGVAERINQLCDNVKFPGFPDHFKGEFHRLTAWTIPAPLPPEEIREAGGTVKWTERTLNVLCTYALSCVTEGSALTPEDAWVWIGSMMNMHHELVDQTGYIPKDKKFAYAIDIFLRIVAQKLHQKFGNKFRKLMDALEANLMPKLDEEDTGTRLLQTFLTEFKQGRFPTAFVDS